MDNDATDVPLYGDFGLGERPSSAIKWQTNWIEWDEHNAFDKPTLLIIGGNKTDCPKNANGYIKEFQKFFTPDTLKSIQIVGVYYDVPDKSLPFFITPHLIADKKFDFHDEVMTRFEDTNIFDIKEPPFSYAERLYQTYIMPLLVDKETHKQLPFQTALKNMRNLNIATHSFGDYFAVKLSEVMYEQLQILGYSKKETADIMKQVAVLTLGGPMAIGQKSHFTTLNVFSTRDKIASFLHSSASWNKYLSDLFNDKNDNKGTYLPLGSNEAALIANRFYASSIKQNEQSEHGNVFFDRGNEKVTVGGTNVKLLSRNFLRNALLNSIQNASSQKAHSDKFYPIPKILDMLRVPKNNVNDALAQLQAALYLENAVAAGRVDYANRIKLLRPREETKFPLPAVLQKKLDSLKR